MSTPDDIETVDVDEWQWRQMLLSKNAPADQSQRLVALAINAFMSGEKPRAWPSQPLIAERSQLSVRQVRRLIERLRAAGWVHVMKSRRPESGQNWKMSIYFPTVPAHLAQHVPPRPWKTDPNWKRAGKKKAAGDDKGAATMVSAPPHGAPDAQMSASLAEHDNENDAGVMRDVTRDGGEDISTSRSGHVAPEVRTSEAKVRTIQAEVRTPECPPKSSSEVINRSSHRNSSREGGLTPTSRADLGQFESPKQKPETAETRIAKLQKVIGALQPDATDEQIRRCVRGATLEEVRQARATT